LEEARKNFDTLRLRGDDDRDRTRQRNNDLSSQVDLLHRQLEDVARARERDTIVANSDLAAAHEALARKDADIAKLKKENATFLNEQLAMTPILPAKETDVTDFSPGRSSRLRV
jgi:hypothetical protein